MKMKSISAPLSMRFVFGGGRGLTGGEVCERHQGATVFVSSKAEIFTRWRNAHIRAEFRGDNHRELSIKWSISESQIRRILSRKE